VNAAEKKWAWLFQPLAKATRSRLEICLGVVLSGAAVVGLSTAIRPDPSRLAASQSAFPEAPEVDQRRAEADLRAEPPPPPKVSPDFAHAVARGDLDTMNRLSTPGMALDGMLAVAGESGEKEATLWLLDHGANVKEDEGTVDAPLLIADEHPEITALLLERGAPETSLYIAAQANASNAVVRLLAAHADVDPTDASPLDGAVSSTRGKAETRKLIVAKLLAAGAKPSRDDGMNPFASAVHTCDPAADQYDSEAECLGLIKLLVKHGAHANGDALVAALQLDGSARDTALAATLTAPIERGATATALAQVWNVPPQAVKLLVSKGVDWAWHDGEEDAALPLFTAVQRGDRDFVRTLLDAGAPPDVHFKDGTCALGAAIDGAAGGGNADFARIVELLVARGTDVNRRLPDGRTPLFAAAETGELRVINALLDRGARVNDLVLDDTALDAAEQNGHQPAARVLHARGARRAKKPGFGRGDSP
jgi:ankyrin repeat protein